MEPITWGWLLTTILSGIVGNRTDAEFVRACSAGWQKLIKRESKPESVSTNGELIIAVNRAFLWAQQSLVQECLDDFTKGTYGGLSAYIVMPGYESDVRWLIAKDKQLKADLKKLEQGKLVLTAEVNLPAMKQLLQDQFAETHLSEQLILAIQKGDTPTSYIKHAKTKESGLLARLAAFFEFELKTNQELQSWFQRELLMQINMQLKARPNQILTMQDLEKVLRNLAQQLPKVLQRLDNLVSTVKELGQDLSEVRTLITAQADRLMTLAVQNTDDLTVLKQLVSQVLVEIRQRKSTAVTTHVAGSDTSSRKIGRLSNVPELPLNFLPRQNELEALKQLLLKVNQTLVVTGSASKIGVHGMGGIGKSVLVATLSRDKEVRNSFPDGIIWLTIGQEPNIVSLQQLIARVLGGEYTLTSEQDGKAFLSELTEDKRCLVVLDDVWQLEHFTAFNNLSKSCQLIVTTRDSQLIDAIGAIEYQVGELTDIQALKLLGKWSDQPIAELPAEAHEIINECGNLPLALAMIGAMVRKKPHQWKNVLHKLLNADLEKINRQFPDYPYKNLLKAIQVSIEALEPEDKKCYLDFAIFPEDKAIHEEVLRSFWKAQGLLEYNIQDAIETLVAKSLLRQDHQGNLSLHDLQLAYIRRQVSDIKGLHNVLLDSYKVRCENGWHTGPNDGYFFENLSYHLIKAGRSEELYSLLTESSNWLDSKFISCRGDTSYFSDLDIAIESLDKTLKSNSLLTLSRLYAARAVVYHRANLYETIDLEALVWLGKPDDALNQARLYVSQQKRISSLLIIFKTLLSKAHSEIDLAELLSEIKETAASTYSDSRYERILLEIVHALIHSGDFLRACQLLKEITSQDAKDEAIKELFFALIKAEEHEQAYLLIKEVRDYDLKINLSKKLSFALLYKADFNSALKISEEFGNYHSRASVLIKAATIFKKTRSTKKTKIYFSQARKIAWRISDYTDRVDTLNLLGVALSASGLRSESWLVFTEAYKSAQSLDESSKKSITLRTLCTSLIDAGFLIEVQEIIKKIRDYDHQNASLGELALAFINMHQFSEAKRILKKITDYFKRIIVLSKLTSRLIELNQDKEAEVLFRELLMLITLVEGYEQSRYAEIISKTSDIFIQNRQFSQAKEINYYIKDYRQRIRKLIKIGSSLQNKIEIKNILVESRYLAGDIKSQNLKSLALEEVAAGSIRQGFINLAFSIVEEIEELLLHADNTLDSLSSTETRLRLYISILSELSADMLIQDFREEFNELFSKSLMLAEQIQDDWLQAECLRKILDVSISLKKFEFAHRIVEKIREKSIQAFILKQLINNLIEIREFTFAISLLEGISDISLKIKILQKNAVFLAKNGSQEEAYKVFTEAQFLKQSYKKDIGQTGLTKYVASVLVQLKQDHRVFATISNNINDNSDITSFYIEIISFLCNAGFQNRAKNLYLEAYYRTLKIEDDLKRTNNLKKLFEITAEESFLLESRVTFAKLKEHIFNLKNKRDKVIFLRNLTLYLNKLGWNIEARINLIKTIKLIRGMDSDFQLSELEMLVFAFAKTNKKAEVRFLASHIHQLICKFGLNSKSFDELVPKLAEMLAKSRHFNQSWLFISGIEISSLQRSELNTFVASLVEAKSFSRAWQVQIWQLIRSSTLVTRQTKEKDLWALGLSAIILASAGEFSRSWKIVTKILKRKNKMNSFEGNLLKEYTLALIHANLFKEAWYITQDFNSQIRDEILEELVVKLACEKRLNQVPAIISNISSKDHRQSSLKKYSMALIQSRRFSSAWEIIQNIDSSKIDNILKELAIELIRVNDLNHAYHVFCRVQDIAYKTEITEQLVLGYVRTNSIENAKRLFLKISKLNLKPNLENILNEIRNTSSEKNKIVLAQHISEILEKPEKSADMVTDVLDLFAGSMDNFSSYLAKFRASNIYEFLNFQIIWIDFFEKVREGFSTEIFQNTLRIGGWIAPEFEGNYSLAFKGIESNLSVIPSVILFDKKIKNKLLLMLAYVYESPKGILSNIPVYVRFWIFEKAYSICLNLKADCLRYYQLWLFKNNIYYKFNPKKISRYRRKFVQHKRNIKPPEISINFLRDREIF